MKKTTKKPTTKKPSTKAAWPVADVTETILASRGTTHGSYEDNARTTQFVKDYWRAQPGWQNLTPAQRETLDMTAHKVSRAINGDPMVNDHWDDIAGYSRLVSKDNDRIRALGPVGLFGRAYS